MTALPTTHLPAAPLTHARVWAVAGPIILSNATTPLLGAVDTAIVGRLGAAHYIGAVAVGATVFAFIYWTFGFLRMGTAGLTAQAHGARDTRETTATLLRACLIAMAVGFTMILLQGPIGALALPLADPNAAADSPERLAETTTYFTIRIWGAPGALASYALVGWLVGLGRTRTVLVIQLWQNGINIALDFALGLWLGYGVAGVAVATVIAEWSAVVMGIFIIRRALGGTPLPGWPVVLDRRALIRTVTLNRDIMIRTILLVLSFAWFTRRGTEFGDVTLAANQVLLQFFHIAAFALDGFAFACEGLVGAAIGARDRAALDRAVWLTTLWGGVMAVGATAVYLVAGGWIIDLLTDLPAVRAEARDYLLLAALTPIVGVWCFQLDGIFIGATKAREMRDAMAISFVFFAAAMWTLSDLGNTGLWLTILAYFVVRALALLAWYPRVRAMAG